jgi:hypothetical protein
MRTINGWYCTFHGAWEESSSRKPDFCHRAVQGGEVRYGHECDFRQAKVIIERRVEVSDE